MGSALVNSVSVVHYNINVRLFQIVEYQEQASFQYHFMKQLIFIVTIDFFS